MITIHIIMRISVQQVVLMMIRKTITMIMIPMMIMRGVRRMREKEVKKRIKKGEKKKRMKIRKRKKLIGKKITETEYYFDHLNLHVPDIVYSINRTSSMLHSVILSPLRVYRCYYYVRSLILLML